MLTPKQQVFVSEYLKCWNASEAARRAGYSDKSARQIGQQNLSKLDIAAEISARLVELQMSANEVLVRLTGQARGSIDDFGDVDKYGSFIMDLAKAKHFGKLGNIKKLKPTKYGYELELYDAQAALDKLGRAHGLFIDSVRHSGDPDNPMRVEVRPLDYRLAIAALAPGSVEDSETPGED